MDVAIEQAPQGIADGLIGIVPLDENSVERRDTAPLVDTGALDELREHREDAGRIAASCGYLTGGQSNFALRHGESSDRVHEQEYIFSLISQRLCNGGGCFCGEDALWRGLVAGRDDGNALLASFFTQIAIKELSDFSSSFTDERDHDAIGFSSSSQHAQKRTLAHPRPREDPDALPEADG